MSNAAKLKASPCSVFGWAPALPVTLYLSVSLFPSPKMISPSRIRALWFLASAKSPGCNPGKLSETLLPPRVTISMFVWEIRICVLMPLNLVSAIHPARFAGRLSVLAGNIGLILGRRVSVFWLSGAGGNCGLSAVMCGQIL